MWLVRLHLHLGSNVMHLSKILFNSQMPLQPKMLYLFVPRSLMSLTVEISLDLLLGHKVGSPMDCLLFIPLYVLFYTLRDTFVDNHSNLGPLSAIISMPKLLWSMGTGYTGWSERQTQGQVLVLAVQGHGR